MKHAYHASAGIRRYFDTHNQNIFSSKGLFRTGLVIVCGLFLFGQFGRVSIFDSQAHVYAYEVILGFLVLLLVVRYTIDGILVIVKQFSLLCFFLAYTTGVLIAGSISYTFLENVIAAMYLVRMFLYVGFAIYGYVYIKNNPEEKNFISLMLIFLFTMIGFISLLQLAFFPNLRSLMAYGWDPHLYRMTGTFLEPAFACAVYGIGVVYLLIMKNKPFYQYVLLFSLGLFSFLTVSRAGIGALIVSIITYILVVYRSWKVFAGVVCLFTCAALILLVLTMGKGGEGMNILRTSTIESRIENYQEAMQIWRQYPIFGVGYNRIGFIKEDFQIPSRTLYEIQNAQASFHSSFLIILVTTGVIGLVLFIVLLIKLGQASVFNRITLLFLSAFALFDNILLHPFVLFIFTLASLACFSLLPSRTSH